MSGIRVAGESLMQASTTLSNAGSAFSDAIARTVRRIHERRLDSAEMKKRWPGKRLVAITVLLMAMVVIGVSVIAYNGRRMGIEVSESRTEYIARVGIPDVTPGLSMRTYENLEATNSGFINGQEGHWGVRITFYKMVFPPGIDRSGFGQTSNAIFTDQSPPFDVFVGDVLEYDGYTFKLTTIDARGDHDSYAGFIILELPPDVTFFPSGDPARW